MNNDAVRALAADSGDRLYVGGSFGRIGGKAMPKLGAVSQTTGAVGGHFTTLPEAKLNRVALASFLSATGIPTAWNPGAAGPFGVWRFGLTTTSLSPNEPAALSIGGDFSRVARPGPPGNARFLL